MIAGFTTVAEDAEIGLLEGDGRVLNVLVDVFKAGSMPEKVILHCGGSSWIILHCGGSSWMLNLCFTMGVTDEGFIQNKPSYAEVVNDEVASQQLG
jgi:hypothetical protein